METLEQHPSDLEECDNRSYRNIHNERNRDHNVRQRNESVYRPKHNDNDHMQDKYKCPYIQWCL